MPAGLALCVGAACTLLWIGWVYEPLSLAAEDAQWPAAAMARLQLVFGEWTHFARWSQSSINVHSYNDSPFLPANPVLVAAVWLVASLCAFAGLRMLENPRSRPDWRTAAVIALACWIALDALWQLRLSRQLKETYQQFAGKSSQQKLAAADDGLLYRFLSDGMHKVDSPEARFFVASSRDYYAMRAAYHLFPANVFWFRRGPELPAGDTVRPGDYVVIVQAETVAYAPRQSLLCWEAGGCRAVDVLALADNAGFFRVR